MNLLLHPWPFYRFFGPSTKTGNISKNHTIADQPMKIRPDTHVYLVFGPAVSLATGAYRWHVPRDPRPRPLPWFQPPEWWCHITWTVRFIFMLEPRLKFYIKPYITYIIARSVCFYARKSIFIGFWAENFFPWNFWFGSFFQPIWLGVDD